MVGPTVLAVHIPCLPTHVSNTLLYSLHVNSMLFMGIAGLLAPSACLASCALLMGAGAAVSSSRHACAHGAQVSRLFSALLQLANHGNVALLGGARPGDPFRLRLLRLARPSLGAFRAPSCLQTQVRVEPCGTLGPGTTLNSETETFPGVFCSAPARPRAAFGRHPACRRRCMRSPECLYPAKRPQG